jgi:ribonuclease HI
MRVLIATDASVAPSGSAWAAVLQWEDGSSLTLRGRLRGVRDINVAELQAIYRALSATRRNDAITVLADSETVIGWIQGRPPAEACAGMVGAVRKIVQRRAITLRHTKSRGPDEHPFHQKADLLAWRTAKKAAPPGPGLVRLGPLLRKARAALGAPLSPSADATAEAP